MNGAARSADLPGLVTPLDPALAETLHGARDSLRIGIAGAGLLGRLLAFTLSRRGHQVTVFDPADSAEPRFDGRGAAAFTAAGMLGPLAELGHGDASIATLGWRSMALWKAMLSDLECPSALVQRGSLMLAHRGDLPAATRVLNRIERACREAPCRTAQPPQPRRQPLPQPLTPLELQRLEPALAATAHAWLLPDEAQIDPLMVMRALHDRARAVDWQWRCSIESMDSGTMRTTAGQDCSFDHVFDVRGVGAAEALNVRGVRGETVWLHAPGQVLSRPARLLHPRHCVYLVPRADDVVLIGATEIESDDRSPVSLQSAVELMASAQSVMPGLAEARILRLDRNLRPALPDNLPLIRHEAGITRINGLFRHGWLVAPALVEQALAGTMPTTPRSARIGGLPPQEHATTTDAIATQVTSS
jgi:glycine oxidase